MCTTASRFSPTALVLLAMFAPLGPAAAQEEPESRAFDSDGVRLHYIDEGAGEPVLLIHGFALDLGIAWVGPGIVSALTDAGYRVVAYDARGHGASEKPHDPAAYGTSDLEDPIRLLDHLGIARAHVIGYSRGAHIAHLLRAAHPERLRSVVLGGFGAGAGPQAGPDSAMRATLAHALAEEDYRPLVRAVATDASPEEVEAWQRRLAERNDGRALAAAFLAPSFPGFAAEELRANRVPTLAVIGERDAFRGGVERMREAMSDLEVLVLAGADHAAALTDPGFVTALLGFLTKHSEAGPVAGAGPSPNDKEGVVRARATGTFDVTLTPEAAEEGPEGIARSRLALEKRFHGDLEGTSAGAMLAARTPVPSSAGYVAIEQVRGTLDGRTGTFVLQHSGVMERGAQRLSVIVVPDSGTDQLAGLAGRMAIRIEGGEHFYELDYTIEERTEQGIDGGSGGD